MGVTEIIALLSGVALFLFGMSIMGDGLKKASGNKLEPILFKLTNTAFKGVLLGTAVTAVIQSSCATAVMVVGFVNSGMMKVRQGIYVIVGATLGTSITGWIICLSYIDGAKGVAQIFSTATLTGIVALVGIILKMFMKKQISHNIGDILLGFAVLMFGMSTMSGAVSGLGKEEWFTTALTSMSNPVLGILAGTIFTAILQSASAAVGIIQALSVTGAMNFDAALPILMGVNIGASLPVILSAAGATVHGKRTALVYPISTSMGVLFSAAVFYVVNAIFNFSFMGTIMNPFSLALVNTIMRAVIVVILLPFTDLIETMINALVREKKSGEEEEEEASPTTRLEERFIAHPALAIEQSRMTINNMAAIAEKTVRKSFELLHEYSDEKFNRIKKLEDIVDSYEDSLGTYLVKLTRQELTRKQNEDASVFLHAISDFESITDLAMSIALKAQDVHTNKYVFSEHAMHELDIMCAAVLEVVHLTNEAFLKNSISIAEQVEPLEEYIDNLRDTIKQNYIVRLQNEECTLSQGIIFNDIVTCCERISDHCSTIAVTMIELGVDALYTHEYLNSLRKKQTPKFKNYYAKYKEKYSL